MQYSPRGNENKHLSTVNYLFMDFSAVQHSSSSSVFFSLLFLAAIGNAYAVLSNPEKRQQYDQYGEQGATETASPSSSQPRYTHAHHRTFHRDFEPDISPEELFNIFFGGRFPTGNFKCSFINETFFKQVRTGLQALQNISIELRLTK